MEKITVEALTETFQKYGLKKSLALKLTTKAIFQKQWALTNTLDLKALEEETIEGVVVAYLKNIPEFALTETPKDFKHKQTKELYEKITESFI